MILRPGKLKELVEPGGLYPAFADLLFKMERKGVFVSEPELRRIEAEADADVQKHTKAMFEMAGDDDRNWNYHVDVAWLLYDRLGLTEMPEEAKSPKQWGKERGTSGECLEYLWRHNPERRPELETIRSRRRSWRMRGYAQDWMLRSYPSEWAGVRVLHPTIGTINDSSDKGRDKTGTATGRLSISNPPLQQVPRDKQKDPYRLRRVFVAPPGKRLAVVDQEQLEVRIQAHLHLALFGDDRLRTLALAGDFHGKIAHEVFSQVWPDAADHLGGWSQVHPDSFKDHKDPFIKWCREQVKAVFYGLAYRKGKKAFGATLWTMAGDPIGPEMAETLMQGVFAQIPAIPKYHQWVTDTVNKHGGMWGIMGGWRPLEKSARGGRQGANHPMQEGGSKVAMIWMLICAARGVDPNLQVHDELHSPVDEDRADDDVRIMKEAAEEAGEILGLKCPLAGAGNHGPNWEEAK